MKRLLAVFLCLCSGCVTLQPLPKYVAPKVDGINQSISGAKYSVTTATASNNGAQKDITAAQLNSVSLQELLKELRARGK